MTLHIGSEEIPEIYHGSDRIVKVYKGNNLLWQTAKTYLSSTTPGNGSIEVTRGFYHIIVIGGGGGSSNRDGGAGAYLNVYVYFPSKRTINYTIGNKGKPAPNYCRNNIGTSGGASSLSTDGLSIVCPGGRYGCGRRVCGDDGLTYAPSYSISVEKEIVGESTYGYRRVSWYGTYGQGANGNGCDEYGNSDNAGTGYILIERY